MSVTRYKIWSVGGPVGHGVMDAFHVGVAGVAKSSNADSPFAVSNELICSELARTLLLPVPPGFIIDHKAAPHYVSLNFNLAGQDLPPADCAAIHSNHPFVAAGIVAFDSWILNGDRHRENLSYDKSTKRIQIFDHSHAFFYARRRSRLGND